MNHLLLDCLKKNIENVFVKFAGNRIKYKDPLEFPVQQEKFLEELRQFQIECYNIENSLTSYSPLKQDMINLLKYQILIKNFKKKLKRRMKEIKRIKYIYQRILIPEINHQINNLTHFSFPSNEKNENVSD